VQRELAEARDILQAQDSRINELEQIVEQQYVELTRTDNIIRNFDAQKIKDLEDRAKGFLDTTENLNSSMQSNRMLYSKRLPVIDVDQRSPTNLSLNQSQNDILMRQ